MASFFPVFFFKCPHSINPPPLPCHSVDVVTPWHPLQTHHLHVLVHMSLCLKVEYWFRLIRCPQIQSMSILDTAEPRNSGPKSDKKNPTLADYALNS